MNTMGVKRRLLRRESHRRLRQDPTIRGRCEQARNHLLIAQIAVKRGFGNSLVQREILRAYHEIGVVKRLLEADLLTEERVKPPRFVHSWAAWLCPVLTAGLFAAFCAASAVHAAPGDLVVSLTLPVTSELHGIERRGGLSAPASDDLRRQHAS